jgi:hypothetical protein
LSSEDFLESRHGLVNVIGCGEGAQLGESAAILIIDPSLGAASGHHAPLARGLGEMMDGADLVFAGACGGLVDRLRAGTAFAPAFGYRLDDAFRVSRHANALMGRPLARLLADVTRGLRPKRAVSSRGAVAAPLDLPSYAALFQPLGAQAALAKLLQRQRWRHVVSIAADPAILAALQALAPVFAHADAPKLHLVFMYPEADYLGPRTEAAHTALVRALLAWPNAPYLYAELAEHAEALQARFGAPVAHQILPYRARPGARETAAPFTVAVLGAGRADKAFDALPAIVAATQGRASDIQFRIQRAAPGQGLDGAERALECAPNVTLLPAFLDDAVYERELARANVILLAYDAGAYARRGSGVWLDAMLYGAPIVCVADTAIARALQGNGVSGCGPDGLAEAIVTARANEAALAATALRVRDATAAEIQHGPLLTALRGA